MDESTQAVEQVSRIIYNGTEVAIRASGDGIKNLAAIIAVALKEESKSSGAMHLKTMLKSGKELTVFHLPKELLKDFAKEAKRYGITYCIIKDKSAGKDGQLELLVKSEDAPKISRVMDRLNYAGIDMEDMDAALDDINAEVDRNDAAQDPPETEQSPEKQQDKQPEGTPKDAPPKERTEEEMKPENPTTARPEKDLPYAHGSQRSEVLEEISMNEPPDPRERKSVRKQIDEIRNDLKERQDKKKRQRTKETPDDILLQRSLEEQRRREEALRGGGSR